eukprot:2987595-Pyramimonas_sp.AAC.1
MQSLFVESVQIALDLFLVNRDPLHDHPYSSCVLVTNIRGFDLDDPPIRRRCDGSIMQSTLRRTGMSSMRGQRQYAFAFTRQGP